MTKTQYSNNSGPDNVQLNNNLPPQKKGCFHHAYVVLSEIASIVISLFFGILSMIALRVLIARAPNFRIVFLLAALVLAGIVFLAPGIIQYLREPRLFSQRTMYIKVLVFIVVILVLALTNVL